MARLHLNEEKTPVQPLLAGRGNSGREAPIRPPQKAVSDVAGVTTPSAARLGDRAAKIGRAEARVGRAAGGRRPAAPANALARARRGCEVVSISGRLVRRVADLEVLNRIDLDAEILCDGMEGTLRLTGYAAPRCPHTDGITRLRQPALCQRGPHLLTAAQLLDDGEL